MWDGGLGSAEGDESGDTGGEDDEEQAHNHLVGGFRIVLLPVPDDVPALPHIHQPQTEKPDDGGDGRDDLRRTLDVGEQLLDKIGKVQARSSSLSYR